MGTTEVYLKITSDRPAFGTVANYLWGPLESIDSDGNADTPESRSWTELTLIKRKDQAQRVDIDPISYNPLILKVSSEIQLLTYACAFFVAQKTGAEWAFKADDKFSSNLAVLSEQANKYAASAD